MNTDLLHRILFRAGQLLRNPTLFAQYKELKNSERLSLQELNALQEKKLRDFISFVGKHSDHYRNLFAELSIDSENFNTDDLFKIPVITKKELIENNEAIHAKYDFKKLFSCETSGTSGQVLKFKRDETWDSFNRAVIMRGYSWYDVSPWEFNIYFWGYNMKPSAEAKTRIFDFLVNRWRIFDYKEKSMALIKKKLRKAVFIEGYSSMIYELAKIASENNISAPNVKMIKGTSEKIFPHYQNVVKKAFDKKMISEYGAAETGIIAFECPHGNMHLNTEGVIVEVDENNEIIVTNLYSYSFPVIRYKLGDVVKLAPKDKVCACGLQHPILEEVTGRVGKNIYGKTTKFPSLMLYYTFKNIYFTYNKEINYQAHQSQPGFMEIWIDRELTDELVQMINTEAGKYFGDEIVLTLKQESNFRQEKGKLKDFITTLE